MSIKLNNPPSVEEVLSTYSKDIEENGVEAVELEAYMRGEEASLEVLTGPDETENPVIGVLLAYKEGCSEDGDSITPPEQPLGYFDNRPMASRFANEVAEALEVDVIERESMTYVLIDDDLDDDESSDD